MNKRTFIQKITNTQWRKHNIRYWLKDPFWGGLDYLTHFSLRYLPISAGARIGKFLGPLAAKYRFQRQDQRVKKNISILQPHLNTKEQTKIANKRWQNIAQSMCEYSVLDKIYNQNKITIYNENFLQPFIDKKQAVIFVFAHTGNWEIFGNYVNKYNFDLLGLYKPVRNRFARKLAEISRQRMGGNINLLDTNATSMRTVCKHLNNNGALWLAIDEYKNRQVLSPSFGRNIEQKNTNLAYAIRLAQRYDAYILPIWFKRENNSSFNISFSEAFKIEKGEKAQQAAQLRIDNMLEEWIIKNLEQWYMLHELRL